MGSEYNLPTLTNPQSAIHNQQSPILTGLLVIDKPQGLTSHDVVQRVRRALRIKQVGHTGTLDPLATGVLVVCVGVATRVSEYLLGHDKTYRATIRLGVETDTYDATGEVIATHPVDVPRAEIAAALARFVGAIQQVPPMHSALKRDGQKLYELARAGIEVERAARSLTIYALDLIDVQTPDITIEVRCSAGTYIRSLAHDVGAALGTGAHLIALRRTAAGPFSLDHAIGLAEFEAAARDGMPPLRSIDEALSDWPRVTVNAAQRQRAITGGRIEALELIGTRCRAYNEQGELIALLTFDQKKQWWRAEKVLAMSNELY
jgi:tRNA pseudouridine55 synthase